MIVAVAFAVYGLAVLVAGKRWLRERERRRLAASIRRLEIACGLRTDPATMMESWRLSAYQAARMYRQGLVTPQQFARLVGDPLASQLLPALHDPVPASRTAMTR